jgi:hypothetical protein
MSGRNQIPRWMTDNCIEESNSTYESLKSRNIIRQSRRSDKPYPSNETGTLIASTPWLSKSKNGVQWIIYRVVTLPRESSRLSYRLYGRNLLATRVTHFVIRVPITCTLCQVLVLSFEFARWRRKYFRLVLRIKRGSGLAWWPPLLSLVRNIL